MHGLQCDTVFAAMLAKHLPADQPIYAFSAPGLDGKSEPLGSVEAMAEWYLEAASEVMRQSAVVLLGFCAGGHIALEMARLAPQEATISHLYLVDAPRMLPAGVFNKIADQQVDIARRRMIERPELARFFCGGALTVRAFTDALNNHINRIHHGPTSILTSRELFPFIFDPKLGWKDILSSSTRIMGLSETRQTLLYDDLSRIGDLLRQEINPR